MSIASELNFDGIIGPTHNYAGLSFGNLASESHKNRTSRPRDAALQGLAKMSLLHELGIPQAVLPPHERPLISALRRLGFRGTDAEVLGHVQNSDPMLLAQISSASPMWTANAALVSPSADAEDGFTHFTPANLAGNFHRSLEKDFTAKVLKRIFADDTLFQHHDPLPDFLGDEGAANHMRLCETYGAKGLELFVYGRELWARDSSSDPRRFPARQSREASAAATRLHRLSDDGYLFLQQSPEAVDAGVFHNDVISVSNQNVFLLHEKAFLDGANARQAVINAWENLFDTELFLIDIPESRLELKKAVSTYLYNSQLVSTGPDSQVLIAPKECEEDPVTADIIQEIISGPSPVHEVRFIDLRQSMNNGGGPACLRFRVVLNHAEQVAMTPGVRFSPELHETLSAWVQEHYREELSPGDLADPNLLEEGRRALDELTEILGLGSIYDWQ